MAILFWIHVQIIDHFGHSLFNDLLVICYIFNTSVALAFLVFLLWVSKQSPSLLGWIFLMISGLKFLLFYALIYPSFQVHGLEPKQAFLTFFIPYTVASFLEIRQLIKILNQEV
jgi:hypothetical protein